MGLVVNRQEMEIDGLNQIVVSTIQPDKNSSAYVRIIQFYTDTVDTDNRRPVLTVTLYGGNQQNLDQSPLDIAVPASVF
jgi:hypothetical protein